MASAHEPSCQEDYCQCRNMCSRKSGKKNGCPCRDENKKCNQNCVCGLIKNGVLEKPCKNKNPLQQTITTNDDGHTVMENDIANAKADIKKIIEPLPKETLEKLIIEMGALGIGSADYISNVLKEMTLESSNDDNDDTNQSPSQQRTAAENERETETSCWCVCKVCKDLGDELQNKCCKKRVCVTSYQQFGKIVLDKDVLEVAIKARADLRAEQINFDPAAYRKAAYYQFVLWKYGKLGRSNRKVLPACVVRMIRNAYPDPNGIYMGFKWS